ncbi:MAG: 16S rRNA (adenine(1518)-N(6)/adenine(1519)-N(6))-dimethyltransferase RsmA [bacterium]
MKLKERMEHLWEKYNFTPKKELGQNFLIDPRVVDRIIESSKLSKADTVVEVGAGTGVLTEPLVNTAGKVIGVEIDKKLCQILKEELGKYDNLEIVCEDIDQFSFEKRFNRPWAVKIVGNLPYQITSSFLLNLARKEWIKFMVVMVQREVVERLLAKPGEKRRGTLTVLMEYYTTINRIIDVPPQAFIPRPKVGSSLIRIDRKKNHLVKNEDRLTSLVRGAFRSRRKMLVNALSKELGKDKTLVKERLNRIGIDGKRRAEDLTMEEFVRVSEAL